MSTEAAIGTRSSRASKPAEPLWHFSGRVRHGLFVDRRFRLNGVRVQLNEKTTFVNQLIPLSVRPRTEARFAVGSRHGQRSTIWKAWVQGDDAYLATRIFGKYQKVSFHSTGQCQWSCTDEWVKQQEGRRNSDRHIVRWEMARPQSDQATLIFKVDIPMSEVRSSPPPIDKKKVFWVAGAPSEATVRFVLFIAPISERDPAPPDTDARRHLFSLRFRSGRWMVVFVEIASLSATDLSAARRAVIEQFLPNSDSHALADLRSVLFSQPNGPELGCNGFIELCLDEA